MSSTPVGVIGLGLLGGSIAARLVERGIALIGFDVNSAQCDKARADGIPTASSQDEVLASCDVVLLSLPNGAIVDAWLADAIGRLRAGQLLIDTTTAAPEQMIAHAELLSPRGVGYVEAEVAGSRRKLGAARCWCLPAAPSPTWRSVARCSMRLPPKFIMPGLWETRPVGSSCTI
ncbi:MAG: NAD(P)-binding domain-containing protein [Pirellulales bacterium]